MARRRPQFVLDTSRRLPSLVTPEAADDGTRGRDRSALVAERIRIVFVHVPDGLSGAERAIYVVGVDGTGLRRLSR